MSKFQYVSLDRVISKLNRDVGIEGMSETDIIEWIGEALEGIGAHGQYQEEVAFCEVSNHQIDMPSGLVSIIQIARNNEWSKTEPTVCPADVVEAAADEAANNTCSGCFEWIPVDCHGKPLGEHEFTYYKPSFNLQAEYFDWCNSSFYRSKFTPVRLADHSFFNSLVCEETNENIEGLYNSSYDEYTIVGDKIRFSFKEGYVAIAFLKLAVDENTGYPMIPDDYSYMQAITAYVTWKVMMRLFYLGREGAERRALKAEEQWQWYCNQAAIGALIPEGEDEYQDILEMHNYMLPRIHRYYGFFGHMSKKENRRFLDPDGRSNRSSYYGYGKYE